MEGKSLKSGTLSNDGYVIFDNHMHLQTEGRFLEAVDMFLSAGGSTFNLVNLPDHTVGTEDHYEKIYSKTLEIASILRRERDLRTPVTLGPYPLDFFAFQEKGLDPVDEMKKGVDLACRYISEGRAHAIGEVGRPHFPVSEEVTEKSDEIIFYCMERAAELDCPVILHTNDLDADGYALLEKLAGKARFPLSRVVKHHALPDDLSFSSGIQRSILASRSNVRKIMKAGKPFLLETDYVDDISLGWKVIPPDSVPRRAQLIKSECDDWETVFESAFRELPMKLFGPESLGVEM